MWGITAIQPLDVFYRQYCYRHTWEEDVMSLNLLKEDHKIQRKPYVYE